MKVSLTVAAKRDLAEIGAYLGQDSPRAAIRLVDRLNTACMAIGDAPRGYPLEPRHKEAGVRRRVFEQYLIVYRLTSAVEILRIIHGARNIDAILGDGTY